MSDGRMMWIECEPCSIGADTVVALLKRIGWREAADLIDRMNERDAAAYRESERWRTAYYELKERYEPSAQPGKPISYVPPPEASD